MTRELFHSELQAVDASELLLPLVGTVIFTGVLAAVLCQPPATPRPVVALFGQAACYVLIAAFGHAFAVWLVRRLFDDAIPWPTETLIVGLWSTVAWLPLLSLLTARESLGVSATLPFIVSCATRFLRRSSSGLVESQAQPPAAFLPEEGLPFWRAMLPAGMAAVALEGGVIALLLQRPWTAGCLLAGSVFVPVWRLAEASQQVLQETRPASTRRALKTSLAAWLLTFVALIPFASGGLLAEALRSLHVLSSAGVHRPLPDRALPGSKGRLQFVVLLQPPQPHERELAMPAAAVARGGSGTAFVVIPFDGSYWYFKHAGDTPDGAVRRERGDPRRVTIRSTDSLPLLMEAHQVFEPPLHAGAARALRVRVTNADDRPGAIALEVIVKGRQGAHSLGTLPLRSSTAEYVGPGRQPVEETLVFPLPQAARTEPIESLTVRLKPDTTRALAAPLVAIQSFALQP